MEFSPKNPALFKATINAMIDFLPRVRMHVSNSGITFGGLDIGHICYTDYKLSNNDCKMLKVISPCSFGIDMKILHQTLMFVGADDDLVISQGVGKNIDKLIIKYTNARVNKKVSFEIATYDIEDSISETPVLDYDAIIKANSADIYSALKEVLIFDSDDVKLLLNEDGFNISAKGTVGNATQTLENTEDREMFMKEDEISVTFSAKHLISVLKAGSSISQLMCLEFKPEIPLRATFLFGADSHYITYIAPKTLDY